MLGSLKTGTGGVIELAELAWCKQKVLGSIPVLVSLDVMTYGHTDDMTLGMTTYDSTDDVTLDVITYDHTDDMTLGITTYYYTDDITLDVRMYDHIDELTMFMIIYDYTDDVTLNVMMYDHTDDVTWMWWHMTTLMI